jgi:hypothetical protein
MTKPRRVLLLATLSISSAIFAAEPISLDEYIARLKAIRISLQENAMPEVRKQAQRLLTYTVASGSDRFQADASILTPLSKAATVQETARAAAQLNVLIEALDRGKAVPATAPSIGEPDHALLERLRKEELARDPQAGGDVALPKVEDQFGIGQALLSHLKAFARWIINKITSLIQWLLDAVFKKREGEPSELLGPVTIMILLMLAGICALIVLDIIRRNRKARIEEPVASAPVRNAARDADPLSRNANEWEIFAKQLTASGNYRESIRAWYHAVLVSMYRSGLLHYRKGRTNWEYCYSLSPQIAWRPQFMELTRRFEWEWYGRNESNQEDVELYAGEAQKILSSLQAGGPPR